MPLPSSPPRGETSRCEDRPLVTSVFVASTAGSGLVCYSLSSSMTPLIEAAGLNGSLVSVALLLGGLLGLVVALGPLAKSLLIDTDTDSSPVDG